MDFSICIRTLGNAGEKYERLMKSIEKLDTKPKEVIVVLPEGFTPPPKIIGTEIFAYTKKGFLSQRVKGYEVASSEYVLMLDDDIEFEPSMVEKLYKTIVNNDAAMSYPLYTNLLPRGRMNSIMSIFLLRAIPSIGKKFYVRIIPPAGYSYQRFSNGLDEPVQCQTGPGMCFMAKRDILLKLNFNKELWVDNPPNYAYMDDAVLFYKAYINNYKIFGVPNIEINHLDAGRSNKTLRRVCASYAIPHNSVIFFHRFIFSVNKNPLFKMLDILAFIYWITINMLFYAFLSVYRRQKELIISFLKGAFHAFVYINKNEIDV